MKELVANVQPRAGGAPVTYGWTTCQLPRRFETIKALREMIKHVSDFLHGEHFRNMLKEGDVVLCKVEHVRPAKRRR